MNTIQNSAEISLDIDSASDFLKIHSTTLGELAGNGQIKAGKIGRAWVFLKSDLVAYLREQIDAQTAERRKKFEGAKPQIDASDKFFHARVGKKNMRKKLPDLSGYPV